MEDYNLRLTWLNEDDPEENHDEFGIVSEDGERLDVSNVIQVIYLYMYI